jgi:hypothetical protein
MSDLGVGEGELVASLGARAVLIVDAVGLIEIAGCWAHPASSKEMAKLARGALMDSRSAHDGA